MVDLTPASILHVDGLVKAFGALRASDGLSLEVRRGEIHALIGPNGAGKTTAIGQLSGEMLPDAGRIVFDGRDITALSMPERARIGLARSYQITSIFPSFSVLDNVAMAIQSHASHSFQFWREARTDAALRQPAQQILDDLGLGNRADTLAGDLAHGEQRQLELAMAMATDPVMLLLDEPMAGMGPEDSQRMTEYLRPLKGRVSMLLVEHDMDVVFALADRITVLVLGRAIATGTPDEIRADKKVRDAYLGEPVDA